MYYTTELIVLKELNEYFDFSEIDGIIFQYYQKSIYGSIVKSVVKRIEKGNPKSDLFIIPEGFEIISEKQYDEDLKNGIYH